MCPYCGETDGWHASDCAGVLVDDLFRDLYIQLWESVVYDDIFFLQEWTTKWGVPYDRWGPA